MKTLKLFFALLGLVSAVFFFAFFPSIADAVLIVLPDPMQFGTVEEGSTTDLSFTLENTGVAQFTGAMTLSSGFFSIQPSSPCNYTIDPGTTKSCIVRYSPPPGSAGAFHTAVATFSGGGGAFVGVSGTSGAAGPAPTTLSQFQINFSSGPATLTQGTAATITGRLTVSGAGVSGKGLVLQASTDGGTTWGPAFPSGSDTTDASGNVSFSWTPSALSDPGLYRLHFFGDSTHAVSSSLTSINVTIGGGGGDPVPTVTMTIDSANPPLANSPVVYRATADDAEGINDIKLFHNIGGAGFVLLNTCSNLPFVAGPFSCVFTFAAGYPAGTNVSYKATATEGGPTPQSADSPVTSVVVAVAGCNNNGVCEGLESNVICPADCTCAAPNSCVVTGTCTTTVVAGSCPGTNVCCTPAGGGGVPTTPTAVTIKFENPLGSLTFTGLINNIINFLFTIAVILAPILLVVAGVIFMTAAGDPGKVKTARSMLMWTIVGFGVILISKGLVTVLKGILGVTGP